VRRGGPWALDRIFNTLESSSLCGYEVCTAARPAIQGWDLEKAVRYPVAAFQRVLRGSFPGRPVVILRGERFCALAV
jgi:hypothetical protein